MINRFINNTGNAKVDYAISDADRIFTNGSKMIRLISEKNDWKFDSGRGILVALALLHTRPKISISLYTPWNRWTSAIGYFDGKSIHINSRKIDSMSVLDITANICHEYAHYCGFSHGNNFKSIEKCCFSVPYFISEYILNNKQGETK